MLFETDEEFETFLSMCEENYDAGRKSNVLADVADCGEPDLYWFVSFNKGDLMPSKHPLTIGTDSDEQRDTLLKLVRLFRTHLRSPFGGRLGKRLTAVIEDARDNQKESKARDRS